MTSFDFQGYLNSRRAAIDGALRRYLKSRPKSSPVLTRAMEYGLFTGGKRIRPLLTLASGELFGGKQKILLPFACAVEMIHSYSLIHDDLPALDDDDLRRGEPTAHKVFGEGLALLAGDALLTEAFHLLSQTQLVRSLPAHLVLDLVRELGQAAGVAGLVGGQALDLEAEDSAVDLATVEAIHVRKTGALIVAAVRVGARAAGAEGADLRRVDRFGKIFGLSFQIADDIVDYAGQGTADGVTESARREKKKATYPAAVGVFQAKERLEELLRQAQKQLNPFGAAAEPLCGIARDVVERALNTLTNTRIEEMHA